MNSDSSNNSDSKEECSAGISGSTTDEPAGISRSESSGLKHLKRRHTRSELAQNQASTEDDSPSPLVATRSVAATLAEQVLITQPQVGTAIVVRATPGLAIPPSEPTQPSNLVSLSKGSASVATLTVATPIAASSQATLEKDSESGSDEVEHEPIPTGDLFRPHKTYESFLEETEKQKRAKGKVAESEGDSTTRDASFSSHSSHSEAATVEGPNTSTSTNASGTADDLESDRSAKQDGKEGMKEGGKAESEVEFEEKSEEREGSKEEPVEESDFRSSSLATSEDDTSEGRLAGSELSCSCCGKRVTDYDAASLERCGLSVGTSEEEISLDLLPGSDGSHNYPGCSHWLPGEFGDDISTPEYSVKSLTSEDETSDGKQTKPMRRVLSLCSDCSYCREKPDKPEKPEKSN